MDLNNKALTIILSGGGTGGHLFPAIAVANEIKLQYPNSNLLFVGANGKMEMEKVPANGYPIIGIDSVALQRKLSLSLLLLPFKVIKSLIQAWNVISKNKPSLVMGFGGFASAPIVFIAALRGIPTVIQEQNSFAGVSNKILGKFASKICVAFDGMERFFPKQKIHLTGNPVRANIANETHLEKAYDFFKLNPNKTTILAIGGSLGALTINKSIANLLNKLDDSIQVIWQTGKSYYATAKPLELKYSNVRVFDFISEMNFAYAVSTIVISRAGAISIAELATLGKSCILVPSPNVAEDHQTKNAQALLNKNACILIEDKTCEANLFEVVNELLNKPSKLTELSTNIKKVSFENAAKTIAKVGLDLINA